MAKKSATSILQEKLIKEMDANERKKLIPELPKCKKCGKPLVSEEQYDLYIKGSWKFKSNKYALIPKEVDGKYYYRKYCEDCIKEKFGKVRTFNVFNDQVIWALEIPVDIAERVRKEKHDTASLESFIRRYGEEEGRKKYKEYCERQAYTNSLEYKKEKYGWSEEEFKKYNQSRAVTLENLIKRYGEEEGRKRWQEYVEKQKNSFIKIKGKDLDVKINKYLIQAGLAKPDFYNEKIAEYWKKIDQFLLENNIKHMTFWQPKNIELPLIYIDESQSLIKKYNYDFAIPVLYILIEFDEKYHHDTKYQKEIDEQKNKVALKNGYTLIRVKEEFNNEKLNKIFELIKSHYEYKGDLTKKAELIIL